MLIKIFQPLDMYLYVQVWGQKNVDDLFHCRNVGIPSMKIKIDDFPPPSMSIGFDVLVGQCTSRRISLFYEFF